MIMSEKHREKTCRSEGTKEHVKKCSVNRTVNGVFVVRRYKLAAESTFLDSVLDVSACALQLPLLMQPVFAVVNYDC